MISPDPDGAGALVRRAQRVRYAYAGLDMVGEYNSAGTLTERYVHGPGADEPIVWYHGAGTSDRRWLIPDERGSIIAATGSAGNPITTGIQTYDEYGRPGTGSVGRFGYTGQMWLPELGLSYYKARMYEPSLGRFMQTDPIGYDGGMNLYNYVGSDPVNFGDPLGLRDMAYSWICSGGYSYTDAETGEIFVGASHCSYSAGAPSSYDYGYYGQDRGPGIRAGKVNTTDMFVQPIWEHFLGEDDDLSSPCPAIDKLIDLLNATGIVADAATVISASTVVGEPAAALFAGYSRIAAGGSAILYAAKGDYQSAGASLIGVVVGETTSTIVRLNVKSGKAALSAGGMAGGIMSLSYYSQECS